MSWLLSLPDFSQSPLQPLASWLLQVLGQGCAIFLYFFWITWAGAHVGDYLSRSSCNSAHADPWPLWAPSILTIIKGKGLSYTQAVLSDYQNSEESTDQNKKWMYMYSPLCFRRMPDSFRLSVVSAMHGLEQQLKMASWFLSPFYQNF